MNGAHSRSTSSICPSLFALQDDSAPVGQLVLQMSAECEGSRQAYVRHLTNGATAVVVTNLDANKSVRAVAADDDTAGVDFFAQIGIFSFLFRLTPDRERECFFG
jgi:hypothetical protein